MVNIEQVRQFLKVVTYRLFVTSGGSTNFDGYWSKARIFKLKFISNTEFTGSSIRRKEYFVTNSDNTIMLKILKLVYNLVETNSFTDILLKDNALKIIGTEAGKGNFSIVIGLIENNEHLQIVVETISIK